MTSNILSLVKEIYLLAIANGTIFTTAESCTAGSIATALTSIEGASQYYDRGFITYSKQSKIAMLNIDEDIFLQYGSVSRQMAHNMAKGALFNSQANFAISVTGNIGLAKDQHSMQDEALGSVYIALLQKNKEAIILPMSLDVSLSRSDNISLIAQFVLNSIREILLHS